MRLPLLVTACALGFAACDSPSGPPEKEPPVTAARDVTPPVVEMGAHGGPYTRNQLRLFGSARDSVGVVRLTYSVNGGAEQPLAPGLVNSYATFFDTYLDLPDGEHQATVYAYDAAGNRGVGASYRVDLVRTAPVITVTWPDGSVASDTVGVTVTATGRVKIASVAVFTRVELSFRFAPLAPSTSITATVTAPLVVGSNQVTIVVTDSVGNRTEVTRSITRLPPPVARLDVITRGSTHLCALRGGTVYCQGSNFFGQLGTRDGLTRDVPTRVAGVPQLASVDAGGDVTCGLTAAGAAYCWGYHGSGVLGRGPGGDTGATPAPVTGNLAFAQVDVGEYRVACGVTLAGAAYCWGDAATRQLGAPTTEQCQHATLMVPCSRTPLAVEGGHSFTRVTVGPGYTCALKSDGQLFCWGRAPFGDLTTQPSLVPVAAAGDARFAQVHAGSGTICGVTTAGAALCWGAGDRGQLGNGTTSSSSVPVQVAGSVRFRSIANSSVLLADPITCGLATDGTVHCWGGGRATPQPLAGGMVFKSVSEDHRCGITTGGEAYCWDNAFVAKPVAGEYR